MGKNNIAEIDFESRIGVEHTAERRRLRGAEKQTADSGEGNEYGPGRALYMADQELQRVGNPNRRNKITKGKLKGETANEVALKSTRSYAAMSPEDRMAWDAKALQQRNANSGTSSGARTAGVMSAGQPKVVGESQPISDSAVTAATRKYAGPVPSSPSYADTSLTPASQLSASRRTQTPEDPIAKRYGSPAGMSGMDRVRESSAANGFPVTSKTYSAASKGGDSSLTMTVESGPWQDTKLPMSVRQNLWNKRYEPADAVANVGYLNGPNGGSVSYREAASKVGTTGGNPGQSFDANGEQIVIPAQGDKRGVAQMNYVKPDGNVLHFSRPRGVAEKDGEGRPVTTSSPLRLTGSTYAKNIQETGDRGNGTVGMSRKTSLPAGGSRTEYFTKNGSEQIGSLGKRNGSMIESSDNKRVVFNNSGKAMGSTGSGSTQAMRDNADGYTQQRAAHEMAVGRDPSFRNQIAKNQGDLGMKTDYSDPNSVAQRQTAYRARDMYAQDSGGLINGMPAKEAVAQLKQQNDKRFGEQQTRPTATAKAKAPQEQTRRLNPEVQTSMDNNKKLAKGRIIQKPLTYNPRTGTTYYAS